MSQFPPSGAQAVDSTPPRNGMAAGSLVTSIIGFVLPGLGIVGIILGLIALRRADRQPETYSGRGMALAGMILGSVSLLMSCMVFLMLGMLLPALGQARNSAREAMALNYVNQAGMALQMYAVENKDWLPDTADWEGQIAQYGFSGMTPPPSDTGPIKYYYVPGYQLSQIKYPSQTIILYEQPGVRRRGGIVLYADGTVTTIPEPQYRQVIDALKTPDGKPYTPHLSPEEGNP